MHRRTPLIAALLAALATAGVFAATSHGAAANKPAGQFRQTLASKLGAQLHRSPDDVLAALKAAHAGGKLTREQRAAKLRERADRIAKGEKPADAQKKLRAWTDSMAKSLDVSDSAVTGAVRALIKQQLDPLVQQGWITSQRESRILARPNLGIGFLKRGL